MWHHWLPGPVASHPGSKSAVLAQALLAGWLPSSRDILLGLRVCYGRPSPVDPGGGALSFERAKIGIHTGGPSNSISHVVREDPDSSRWRAPRWAHSSRFMCCSPTGFGARPNAIISVKST
ncbi:hypothetical protein FALBO_13961 [Fusarium albosuccineum]|uniref:Uncharacterized protein n=1 Tax=Fusarium albosuccineum TaxID=1237068 RepID=A0A8H4L067_9HYPO|nr:hypothetical protein FALBO_13961 [Fusarium albosuccineum]